jgi:uncharacterized lipoprotein YmbA
MNKVRRAVVCGSLALVACSLSRPMATPASYVVEPISGPLANTRQQKTMRVGNVRVASSFAGIELVYRIDDVRYTQDFYNRFIAPPGPMIGYRIAEWLARSGPYHMVITPGAIVSTAYVLDGVVTELYGDFRSEEKPAAVMTVQFYVLDVSQVTERIVLERSISRRVDLPQSSAAEVVRGYNVALGQILVELSEEMARSGPK